MTLSRLRVRLTLWYAATFAVILLLLGTGLFLAIGTQVSRRLDASLVAATAAIVRATHDLEAERAAGGDTDAVAELRIPDRELYRFDANGRAITPAQADAWIADAAHIAAATGRANVQHMANGGHQLRLHGERFTGSSGTTYVAIVVAERPNIREQYASLIGIFGDAALHGGRRARAAHARHPAAHAYRAGAHTATRPCRGRRRVPGHRTGSRQAGWHCRRPAALGACRCRRAPRCARLTLPRRPRVADARRSPRPGRAQRSVAARRVVRRGANPRRRGVGRAPVAHRARQRDQIHATGRLRPARRYGPRRQAVRDRDRQRHRDSRRGIAAHLRALLSRGQRS